MTPGEITQLPATDEIVMVSGVPPVRAKKLRYYKDGNFTRRVIPPAPGDRTGSEPGDQWGGAGARGRCFGTGLGGSGGSGAGGLALEPELAPLKRAAPVVDVVEEGPRTDFIPEGEREIAHSLGHGRFDYFIEQVARKLTLPMNSIAARLKSFVANAKRIPVDAGQLICFPPRSG